MLKWAGLRQTSVQIQALPLLPLTPRALMESAAGLRRTVQPQHQPGAGGACGPQLLPSDESAHPFCTIRARVVSVMLMKMVDISLPLHPPSLSPVWVGPTF